MQKLILTLFLTLPLLGYSQVSRDSELFKTLESNDSLLFSVGFNNCDLSQFEKLLSANFEFYHDQGGLQNSKPDFIRSFGENMCSPERKPVRQLKKETLEVFPLYSNGELYGAVQRGIHDFFELVPNEDPKFTGSAKFTHLWILEDENWRIRRVLSFDH